MKETLMRGLVCLAMIGLIVPSPALAGEVLVVDVNPGETETVECVVTLPCDTSVAIADVYILADTTGSMGSVISSLQSSAASLVSTLLSDASTDIQIGIGNYKDFPFDPFAFQPQQTVTDDETAINAAISGWVASGGSDGSEGQLYALTRIARDNAGEIGWRSGAARFVVWFGDAPGHDSVCQAIHGDGNLPFDITEATTTTDLTDADATVFAISTPTGFPDSLNDDPTLSAGDYAGTCTIGGTAGQANRITAATGGFHTDIKDPDEIAMAILDAIEVGLSEVDVELCATGDIVPFVTNIEPAIFKNVVIPACPEEDVVLRFQVTFEGGPCVENTPEFEGALEVKLDGVVDRVKPVLVTQSECAEAVCLLIVGEETISRDIDDNDILLVKPRKKNSRYLIPVTMEDIPQIRVPNDPRFEGRHVYLQVYMSNPVDFPGDPVQLSNGLRVTIGDPGMPATFGPDTTIDLWSDVSVPLGGVIDVSFLIEGL